MDRPPLGVATTMLHHNGCPLRFHRPYPARGVATTTQLGWLPASRPSAIPYPVGSGYDNRPRSRPPHGAGCVCQAQPNPAIPDPIILGPHDGFDLASQDASDLERDHRLTGRKPMPVDDGAPPAVACRITARSGNRSRLTAAASTDRADRGAEPGPGILQAGRPSGEFPP